MKYFFGLTGAIFFAVSSCQQVPQDNGFTNISEAKNETVNGAKEGKWVEYIGDLGQPGTQNDFKFYKLTIYKAGNPYGIVRGYYKDGKLNYEIPYKDGKRNGVAKFYYESGNERAETPFTDDKINGVIQDFYENGKLKEEKTFVNGKEGDTKNYDESGNETKPVADVPDTRVDTSRYPDGKIFWIIPYTKHQKNGTGRQYDENGVLRRESPFVNDIESGVEKFYNENGKLVSATTYTDGVKGATVNYDANGNEIK